MPRLFKGSLKDLKNSGKMYQVVFECIPMNGDKETKPDLTSEDFENEIWEARLPHFEEYFSKVKDSYEPIHEKYIVALDQVTIAKQKIKKFEAQRGVNKINNGD